MRASSSATTLRRRFKLQAQLAALTAKRIQLLIGRRDFRIQPLRIALQRSEPLFRLGDAIANR